MILDRNLYFAIEALSFLYTYRNSGQNFTREDVAKVICLDPDVKEALKDCTTANQYKEKLRKIKVSGSEFKEPLKVIDNLCRVDLIHLSTGVGCQHKAGTERMTLAGIFQQMQGHPICFVKCKEETRTDPDCPRVTLCKTQLLYQHIGTILSVIFRNITIQDIADKAENWKFEEVMALVKSL